MLPTYEVLPHCGIGPLRLGMARTEARRCMHVPPTAFRKTEFGPWVDAWHECGFQASYSDASTIEFLEASRGAVDARLRGIRVFETDVDEVIRRLRAEARIDEDDPELPYSFVFPEWDLALWRQLLPRDPDDTVGRRFDTVGVGMPGYYGRPANQPLQPASAATALAAERLIRQLARKMRPELKQFGDLRPTDFERVPVWAACHSFDHDEVWYDDTDEETFRPWLGDLPVDPSDGMYLVRARFRLADGRTFTGFATPATLDGDGLLGLMQPHLAVGDRFFSFWGGLVGVDDAEKTAFYLALGSDRRRTFPIAFACDGQLAGGATSGTVDGFYRSVSLDHVVVEQTAS